MRKPKPPREQYVLTLHRPDGVSVQELGQYIVEAVHTWGGQLHDDDPLFYPWPRKGPRRITIARLK